MANNPLLDEDFLHKLDEDRNKITWAKIVSLNWNEEQQEEITGRIASGSISVDGSSAVRRVCSLSLVANEVNINDFYWSQNTKFKVAIGVQNIIDSRYPDVIWFNQGIYIISTFNCSASANSYTINITGKDKMCLLNGEVGGIIPASWDFATEDVTLDDGSVENRQIPVKDIILQAVHEYAQEPWENIIVNDLDDYGVELLEYEGDNPLYYIIQLNGSGTTSREVVNMTLNGSMKCKVQLYNLTEDGEIGEVNGQVLSKTLDNLEFTGSNGIKYSYEKLIDELDPAGNVAESPLYFRTRVKFDGDDSVYTIAKITSDNGMQVCGYRITDITYPYDLIVSAGTVLTVGVLDKLVEMLGAYEYFYDVDGRFIFQKKKTYTNDTYTGIQDDYSSSIETWSDNNQIASKYSYTFEGSTLVLSYQNSPNFTNLKNDYSLWSTRKSASDTEVNIHMRYAIEHKPKFYKPIGSKNFYATKEGVEYYRKLLVADSLLDNDIPVNIQNELLEMRSKYPTGLSKAWFRFDDWMRIFSWAELYNKKQAPDSLYSNELYDYYNKNYSDAVISDNINYTKYMIDGSKYYTTIANIKNAVPVVYGAYVTDESHVSVFTLKSDGSWSASHGGYCVHTYNYLKERYDSKGEVSYIYDPRLIGEGEDDSILNSDTLSTLLDILAESNKYTIVDWRELIFLMARDYRKYRTEEDFLERVRKNNMYNDYDSWYPRGYTGYEKYYVDFEMNVSQGVVAYWRELYNPNAKGKTGRYISDDVFESDADCPAWVGGTAYAKDDRVIHNDMTYKSMIDKNTTEPGSATSQWAEFIGDYTYNEEGWNPDILNNPELLNFWFDFLDTDGELNKFSVSNIGQRTKAVNDSNIKAIYFRETPNVIFETADDTDTINWRKAGYCYMRIPQGLDDLFSISSQGKNALDAIEDYLYEYTYTASSISITSVPIYYLTPNTLIYVTDKNTGISGEYNMSKFTIQLGLGTSMTITATETAKRIY